MPETISSQLTFIMPSSCSFNSIIIKKVSSSLSIPIHLDHNLFGEQMVVIPLFPVISFIQLYSHTQRRLFNEPILITPPSRFHDFLSLELTSNQPAYLMILTSVQEEFHCTCGSSYCLNTIKQNRDYHSEYQTEYVDQVCMSFYSNVRPIHSCRPILQLLQPSSLNQFFPLSLLSSHSVRSFIHSIIRRSSLRHRLWWL